MTTTPRTPSYVGYRFPAEVISYAVYLYFRFPLSLRMVEEMLAVRGIEVRTDAGISDAFGSSTLKGKRRLPTTLSGGSSRARMARRFGKSRGWIRQSERLCGRCVRP